MIFIRYRTHHASGTTEWKYLTIKDYWNKKEAISTFIQSVHDNHVYSDKYRGCDVETVKPSTNYLKQELINCQEKIKFYNKIIDKLNKLISKSKKEPPKKCPKCIHYSELEIVPEIKRTRCSAGHSSYTEKELEKAIEQKLKLTCPDMKEKGIKNGRKRKS